MVLVLSALLASAACGARPPEAPRPRTIRVPGDFALLAEAIAANPNGATVEIGPGTFSVGEIKLTSAESAEYTIRGSGITRTVIRAESRTADTEASTLFRASHVTLRLQDLTLKGPECASRPCYTSYGVRLRDATLSLSRVKCELIEAYQSTLDVEGSSLSFLKARNSSVNLSRVEVGLAPGNTAMEAGIDTFADGGVSNTVIRDSRFGDGIALVVGLEPSKTTDLSPAKHTVVVERSMFLDGSEGITALGCDMEVTIDHAVFYRTGSGGPPYSSIRLDICSRVSIRNSMFVENRGPAIQMRPDREREAAHKPGNEHWLETSHNLGWKNAGGNYGGWTPEPPLRQPFLEADPMFVNPASGDFHVKPGSRALRAASDGTDLGSVWSELANRVAESAGPKAAGPAPVGSAARRLRGRKLALVVGVQDYSAPIRHLKYARSDAQAITTQLRGAGYEVTLLTDTTSPPASVPEVRKALIALTQAGIDDSVVMYFSVHGSGEANPFGRGRGFLLLTDAQQDSIASTALPLQDIENTVGNISSERVVLILDACFSGSASTAGVKSITSTTGAKGEGKEFTGSLIFGKGKIGLYSSRDNEASLESDEFKHGYFTYFLLDAWQQGMRSAHDVYDHVQREVVRTTHGQQHPRYSSEQAEGEAPTF